MQGFYCQPAFDAQVKRVIIYIQVNMLAHYIFTHFLGMLFHIIGDELIHARGEADHFRRDVVDEHSAIDTGGIQVPEKCFGRAAVFGDFIEVLAPGPHQRERFGLEHFDRLDMDVAVGDQVSSQAPVMRVW